MNNPLVSIVIPVYNGSNYLKYAIDSALGQDYDNIEVIVVNDGSTDNTEEIAKNYGDKIRYFSKENGGVATALNLAIRNAKGEYISWLSHDDYYLSNKVSKQINEFKKDNVHKKTIIFSNFNIIYILNKKKVNEYKSVLNIQNSGYLNKIDVLKILFLSQIHGCTLLIPKNAFEDVGYFDESLKTTQDYDLYFKLLKNKYCFYYLYESLIFMRNHENQDTKKKLKLVEYEVKALFENAYKTFKDDIEKASKDDFKIFKMVINRHKLYYRIKNKIIKIYQNILKFNKK